MPELPEVETVRRQLEPMIVGRRVVRAWARIERITRPTVREFTQRMQDVVITAAARRGKQLYFSLDSGEYLLVHLGMSGRLSAVELPPSADPESFGKHTHAVWWLDDGAQMVYTDPRTFGLLEVAANLDVLAAFGPEPLDSDFDAEALAHQAHRRGVKVKSILLDQHTVAGLGSIYADESCFLARVHPAARACDVPVEQLCALFGLLRGVLERAIEARGATLKDGAYQDVFGRAGTFHPAVYGNAGLPCPRCGTVVLSGKLGQGKHPRSYHYCPSCQPLPKRLSPPPRAGEALRQAQSL